ncbi:response regulator transcription factor [Sphingobium sp. H39-3-25]|jgi:DNA-binding response OmpR family regulator|uniref:response regulator transcription factor n=1 Tax=Sphingobium arseniciresistens TaxID=3030834 RepID=UPI0023B8E030|nr:response regulator transcription factor [Sphingobium arseniciresistens]
MTAPNVLIVEDDPALRTLVMRSLQQNGFVGRPAGSAPEMWNVLNDMPIDVVILDVMLPGTQGLDLCRQIRQQSDVPIIFVSAKGTEVDRVIGLELGADDYLAKPFDTRELIARIRAILRRGRMDRQHEGAGRREARFDGWTVDFPRREVRSPSGAAVDLTGAEFDLLTTLIDNPQRVIARERLIEMSRTRLGDSSDRSVDVLISRLRRKISQTGGTAPIVTVRGIGYMFSAEVERV